MKRSNQQGRESGTWRRLESGEQSKLSFPRLIVSDAVEASRIVVAKTRAEVRGLEAVLQLLARSTTFKPE